MAHNFRPDLDEPLPQRRQRPVPHRPRQHRLPQKITQIVGQHEQVQPHLVVHKVMARQPRPLDRVLALLDPLCCEVVYVIHRGISGKGYVGSMKIYERQGECLNCLTQMLGPPS